MVKVTYIVQALQIKKYVEKQNFWEHINLVVVCFT